MKKIMYIAAAALLGLTACTEDYKDWVPQTQPTQPATVTFGDGSVTEMGVIDLNTLSQEAVQVASIVAPTASEKEYEASYTITLGETTYPIEASGLMTAEDLQAYVSEVYGLRPTERDIPATISMWLSNGATAVKTATSGVFQVKVIPAAPVIEEAYYYVGASNNWDTTDQTFKLQNGGGDVYDDPVFTIVLPAPVNADGKRVDNWFKIAPASAYTREEGFWGGDMVGAPTDGQSDAEGRFVLGANDAVAKAFCIGTADDEALYYRLEFNMLDQTYKVTPIGFNEYIYEIGNESGWSEPHALYCPDGKGQYSAVLYLDGEFKFKPNKDNWDGDWEKASGDGTSGTLTDGGGPNVDAVAAGFYFVQVDLKALTYKLTPVKTIGIIGNGGDWNNDIPMTYNENLKCWEVRTTLAAGEFKFRANQGWDINWGGAFDNLTQGGANLSVDKGGDYIVRLYLSDEAPAHCTVVLDLGYPDFIYEIGNESSWSASHPLVGNGKGQYTGFCYLNGEFKFKPNADNWDGDWERLSGDNYAGVLTPDGSGNVGDAPAGMYMIDIDLDALTYQLTALTSVSIIGNGGNWDNDIEMSYNVEAGCFEVTTELAAGEFKFRANHGWDINWGGAFDNLTQGGANLSVADAGSYKVQLFLSYAGKHYCTLTKQ